MTLGDPLLFLRNRKTSKELGASVWSWRNIENAAEYVGNFKAQEAEGHVCEASPLLGELCHIRSQIGVVDVEWL